MSFNQSEWIICLRDRFLDRSLIKWSYLWPTSEALIPFSSYVSRCSASRIAETRDTKSEMPMCADRKNRRKLVNLIWKLIISFLSLEFRETAMPLEIKIFVEIIDFTLSRLNQCHAESKSWQSPNAVFRNWIISLSKIFPNLYQLKNCQTDSKSK